MIWKLFRASSAPHLVDGLVGEFDDVKFVERDLGVGEVLFDPRLECSPHVDAGVGHRFAPAAMRLEEIREFLHGRRVLAVGDVDDLAPRHVNEQADVVVAALAEVSSAAMRRTRDKSSFSTARQT